MRQEFIPADLWQEVLALATDEPFRDWLSFMLATGARVTEMFKLEAGYFDGQHDARDVRSFISSKKEDRRHLFVECAVALHERRIPGLIDHLLIQKLFLFRGRIGVAREDTGRSIGTTDGDGIHADVLLRVLKGEGSSTHAGTVMNHI